MTRLFKKKSRDSINHIRTYYLHNLSVDNKKIFLHKLKSDQETLKIFLLHSLKSQSVEIVGTALILFTELFEMIDHRSRIAIASLLQHDDEWVRERASEALSRFATIAVFAQIKHGLTDENEIVRSNLCEALSHIKNSNSARLVLQYIDDKDGLVRASAVESAEKMELREAVPLVEDRLNDREPLVRGFAAKALYSLKGAGAIDVLAARLKDEKDWFAKLQILKFMYLLSGDSKTLRRIMNMLKSARNHVRNSAVDVLVDVAVMPGGTEQIINALRRAKSKETDQAIRRNISVSLKTLWCQVRKVSGRES